MTKGSRDTVQLRAPGDFVLDAVGLCQRGVRVDRPDRNVTSVSPVVVS